MPLAARQDLGGDHCVFLGNMIQHVMVHFIPEEGEGGRLARCIVHTKKGEWGWGGKDHI